MHAFFARLCWAGILITLSVASSKAADRPDSVRDYSQTIPVRVSGQQAVVQLALPKAVYFGARSPDLHDLRLFDATGRPVPFALVEQVKQAQEQRSTAQVSIFPVRGPASGVRMSDALEIRTGDNGPVISVKAPSVSREGDVLISLVLDLGGASHASIPVTALSLTLPPGTSGYSAQLALDVSDDLQEWTEIGITSVNWLINNQGASVTKNRIVFPPQSFRFARLRWLDGPPIEFTAISAEFVAQRHESERWESVVLQSAPASSGADLVYEAPPALPVQSLGLELQSQNVVMPVQIGYYQNVRHRRPGERDTLHLQTVTNTTFYQLTQNGQRRASGDIDIPLTHARQWIVRPQTTVVERPGLRLRWKPANLIFVANGSQPYSLAFGRDGVAPVRVAVSHIAPGFSVSELASLEQAVPGELVMQHGSAGNDEASGATRRNMIWLWGLLLTGVAVLGLMAYRLVSQMNGGTREQPPG